MKVKQKGNSMNHFSKYGKQITQKLQHNSNTMIGCTNTEQLQIDIAKKRLNSGSNNLQRLIKQYFYALLRRYTTFLPRIYSSRPSCIIYEFYAEYLLIRFYSPNQIIEFLQFSGTTV